MGSITPAGIGVGGTTDVLPEAAPGIGCVRSAPAAEATGNLKQDTAQPTEKRGAKLFGFNILPRLDFGLELLYSQQPIELQQATPLPEDNEDLTVLGKVKRRF